MTTATPILFDPSDPELRRDPYPTYRRLREQAPVWCSPDGIWYLTKYQDCYEMLRHPALSYDRTRTRAFHALLAEDPVDRERQLAEYRVYYRTMLDVDPPDHTRLRSLVNRAFTAPVVQGSRSWITGVVDRLIDDFEGPTVDLVSQFALLVPIVVICDILGIDAEERHDFVHIIDRVAKSADPNVELDERLTANRAKTVYFRDLIERRRADPGDDLITRLIAAADDGRIASDDELIANTSTLLAAGFETTTNLITNAVCQLLEHPAQLREVRADPSLIGTTIEETLRFDPPVQLSGKPRTFTTEVDIRGVTFQPGDPVVPIIAAANRDPDEFDDPDTFNIRRVPNRHLSFGMGPHLCIGAALARLEGQVAVQRLFERYPDLAIDGDPTFRPNLALRGFAHLPVAL